ncbi:hypothetical protein H8A97_12950 [Bradyrhizobium sp. Arg62]|uniref:hypothetical protein n=1 Tax=Bradyrhizobium brasilense TaxID=1419277 RepID=UPI001E4F8EA8|nr:hypothetical protein [Bradyrhizobium brasilense]MCC8945981.1 hypothetical protein [Bradyrhizobium brasilense]
MHLPVDDERLIAALDDTWRTAQSIKFRVKGSAEDVAAALVRLAGTGRVERKVEPTKGTCRALGGGTRVLTLATFRRLQPAAPGGTGLALE